MIEANKAGGWVEDPEVLPSGLIVPYLWLVIYQGEDADPSRPFQLPKGTIEPGETSDEAAVREVLEELGLRAIAGAKSDVITRPGRTFVDGRFAGREPKVIIMHPMTLVSRERLAKTDEIGARVRVRDELPGRMYYPEEGEAVAGRYNLTWPPVRAGAVLLDVAAAEAEIRDDGGDD